MSWPFAARNCARPRQRPAYPGDVPRLILLSEPAWDGTPIVGERSVDLLAALHLAGDRGASAERLVEELWPDSVPSNAAKALQVVVSRTRKATAGDAIVSQAHGYRLGRCTVDADELDGLAQETERSLAASQPAAAISAASRACAIAVLDPDGSGPLARLRRDAQQRQRGAHRTRALALARSGAGDEAYPLLVDLVETDDLDEEILGALLLAEAGVKGPAAALERYDRHRELVGERLGLDPSPQLRRVHAQLLASDRPARQGVRFDADDLVGRDDDLGAMLGLLAGHRVVTILGPGGLGKTRMAHLVARHAPQPVVHVVELVGVRSADDVVGEVGSVLGVRDSVSALGALTATQRADVRSRIAAHLDRAPSLLVFDNCEHVVGAVADLVAFLVATTRDLRVLATSRSPLSIAAERVYPLSQLDEAQACELFAVRATSVRPAVVLDGAEVAQVVARLDGLPLAIELAAAKVRVMSVAEIARRLDNRFELLRGRDRSAPDRHQTLLAVIDWSWGLLAEGERRALRRLSVFSDGFTLQAAEALVGPSALHDLEALVDQSMLTLFEQDGAVRYRMLETVREFGSMHLVDAGDDADAFAAQRRWALEFVAGTDAALFSARQAEEVARLLVEETNLSDVLRRSLAVGDQDAVVEIMAALVSLWTIRGEHARAMMLVGPVDAALAGYEPSPGHEAATRVTALLVCTMSLFLGPGSASVSLALLQRLGPGEQATVASSVRVMTALLGGDDETKARAELARLTRDGDRLSRAHALRWSAQMHENEGDGATAIREIEEALALWRPEDGIWTRAMLHMGLSQLAAQGGDLAHGARHARLALPDLLLLTATDDAIDARSIMALEALRDGDVDRAQELVDANSLSVGGPWIFGGAVVNLSVEAEISFARGYVALGLDAYRRMAAAMQRSLPGLFESTGLEPWTLYGLATAAAAHALHGVGEDLYDELVARLPALVDSGRIDYPVLGVVLYAVGFAGLAHDRLDPSTAAAMLVLAERCGYVRVSPSLAWDHATALVAERGGTAELDAAEKRFGSRRGPELLDEVRAVVEELRI